jgi:hypothetical protein
MKIRTLLPLRRDFIPQWSIWLKVPFNRETSLHAGGLSQGNETWIAKSSPCPGLYLLVISRAPHGLGRCAFVTGHSGYPVNPLVVIVIPHRRFPVQGHIPNKHHWICSYIDFYKLVVSAFKTNEATHIKPNRTPYIKTFSPANTKQAKPQHSMTILISSYIFDNNCNFLLGILKSFKDKSLRMQIFVMGIFYFYNYHVH